MFFFFLKKRKIGDAGSLKITARPSSGSTLSRPCGEFKRSGMIGFAWQGEIAPHKLVLGYTSEIQEGPFGSLLD